MSNISSPTSFVPSINLSTSAMESLIDYLNDYNSLLLAKSQPSYDATVISAPLYLKAVNSILAAVSEAVKS